MNTNSIILNIVCCFFSDCTVGDSTDSEADPDRFRCKLCGQTYTTISNLRGHVKIVHGGTFFKINSVTIYYFRNIEVLLRDAPQVYRDQEKERRF